MRERERVEREAKLRAEYDAEMASMLSSEVTTTFEQWKKDKKKAEEAEKKKGDEERDQKRREAEEKRREERRREKKEDDVTVVEGEDDLGATSATADSKGMRGYKTRDDGRKTTFFNREISEADKQLIGSITPQRIDSGAAAGGGVVASDASGNSTAPKRIATTTTTGGGDLERQGSAWNTAGTWEERDMTSWAQGALKRHLETASAVKGDVLEESKDNPNLLMDAMKGLDFGAGGLGGGLGGGGGADALAGLAGLMKRVEVRVKSVKDIEGDASITMVRGTARYLFEMSTEVDWEATVTEKNPGEGMMPGMPPMPSSGGAASSGEKKKPKKYRGTFKLPELSSTVQDSENFEVERRWKKTPDQENRAVVEEALGRLETDVNAKIRAFVAEYRAL